MAISKRLFPSGEPAAAAFDPLQNFETVTYTGNGGTQKITGYIRKGAAFNGSSSYIVLPKLPTLTSNVSFSGWFNLGNTTTSNRLRAFSLNAVNQVSGWAGTLESLYRPSDGEWVIRVGDGTSSDTNVLTHTYQLTQSTWYHICFTRDNSTNITKFYINGLEQDSETVSATATIQSSAISVIGNQANLSSLTTWNGKIDQVRIFNKALSSGEVTTLYGETYASSTKSTTDIFGDGSGVALYELDEDASDTGGTYNGTPTNVNFLGMAFQPDLVWIKTRNQVIDHILTDSVRGVRATLFPNLTNAETTFSSTGVTSFDTNGFTVSDTAANSYGVNGSGYNHVAWCWKAGGAAVSNTDGTITSQVSANQAAGFSIVNYAGASTVSGDTKTVGHGLSSAPELVIVKNIDTTVDWLIYHTGLTSASYFLRFTTAAEAASSSAWGDTAPTNSVFSVDYSSGTGRTGYDYIAYCFHSVDGYQKVGSYTMNGSTLTIDVGFPPRFVLYKEATRVASWVIADSGRPLTGDYKARLYPDLSNAESTSSQVQFSGNTFILNYGTTGNNATSGTGIYLAIA